MSKNEYRVEDLIESLRICAGEGDGEGCENCCFCGSGMECCNGNKLLMAAADMLEELWKEIQSKW